MVPLVLVAAWGCGQDKNLTFARLLERSASWASAIEFAIQLTQDGLVPRHYLDDLMATASQELATLATQIDDAASADADAKRQAAASCTGLAALAGDAARTRNTPTVASIRELELQLRSAAQHARSGSTR